MNSTQEQRRLMAPYRIRTLRRISFPAIEDLACEADADVFNEYVSEVGLFEPEFPTDEERAFALEEARYGFEDEPVWLDRIEVQVEAWKREAMAAQIELKAVAALVNYVEPEPLEVEVEPPTLVTTISSEPGETPRVRPDGPNAPPHQFILDWSGSACPIHYRED